MSKVETINRDVGAQSKGLRLQKLRAINLILEAIERPATVVAYCAVELGADVLVKEVTQDGVQIYQEEDKNYDKSTNFTFASNEILNTLVYFIDAWIANGFSENVIFGFYTPNNFAKEKASPRSKKLNVEWPAYEILEKLCKKEIIDDGTLECIKSYVLDEYAEQYASFAKSQNGSVKLSPTGNLRVIETWKDEQWRSFFAQITWEFGREDDRQLETSLVLKIQTSKLYDHSLADKEYLIISALCDLLDRKQAYKDRVERHVHSAEVDIIFRDVKTGSIKIPDPAFLTWESLDPPDDTRGLREKVEAVCQTITEKQFGRWARMVANSLNVERSLNADKTIYSVKYHVLSESEVVLEELMRVNENSVITSELLTKWVEELVNRCESRIERYQQHYTYVPVNRYMIAEMIWELIDSCYLGFDLGAA